MNRDLKNITFEEDDLKRSAVEVLRRHYSRSVDGYLILGKLRHKGKKRYVVGWQSRHAIDHVVNNKFHRRRRQAKKYFNEIVGEKHRTGHSLLTRDWQKRAVYDWEDDFILSKSKNQKKINKKQAKALIEQVCADYGVPKPKLVWEPLTYNSAYDDETHTIHFGHRDILSLLHELAHAVHFFQTKDITPGFDNGSDSVVAHSPEFVWILIELYARYAGFNLNYLVTSAQKRSILGDLDENQILHPESRLKPGNDNREPVLGIKLE